MMKAFKNLSHIRKSRMNKTGIASYFFLLAGAFVIISGGITWIVQYFGYQTDFFCNVADTIANGHIWRGIALLMFITACLYFTAGKREKAGHLVIMSFMIVFLPSLFVGYVGSWLGIECTFSLRPMRML